MTVHQGEGCFDRWRENEFKYPVNWRFIGSVFLDEDLPEFIMIDGVVYEKK